MKTLLLVSIPYLLIMTHTTAFKTPQPIWFGDLLMYIQNNNESYRQVIVVSSGTAGETFDNHWVRRILHAAMAMYPTIRVNVNLSSDAIENNEKWASHRIDPTATLFIFVDNIWPPRFTPPNEIISIMKDLSLNKKLVKYLVIFFASEETRNFEDFLRHGWKVQILDLVILEVNHCQREATTILKRCIDDDKLPVIHYFNPFLDLIIKKTYESGTELFPDLMSNMHGYSLKIGIRNRPPFSYVNFDAEGNHTSIQGIDISLLQTLAEKMNFTPVYSEVKEDTSPRGLFNFIITEKIDILATPNPHYTENKSENLFRSETLFRDRLCAIVPITRAVRIPFSIKVIESMVLTIGIVVIFWASTWLFRFHKSWSIFLTIRVLFGIPVRADHFNLKLPQRLIIQIFMIVALFYSANIYGSLTQVRIDVDSEVKIESFEDLDRSGLTPVISLYHWNKTFENIDENDAALVSLKNKAVTTKSIWECPGQAGRYKNVTCLMGRNEGDLFIRSTYQRGKPTLKFTNACFWSDSYAFLVRAGSPYRERMDKILNLFSEFGLKIMWFRNDSHIKLWELDSEDELVEVKTRKESVLLEQLAAVSIFGCITATAAFIGELLWYYGSKKWRNMNGMNE